MEVRRRRGRIEQVRQREVKGNYLSVCPCVCVCACVLVCVGVECVDPSILYFSPPRKLVCFTSLIASYGTDSKAQFYLDKILKLLNTAAAAPVVAAGEALSIFSKGHMTSYCSHLQVFDCCYKEGFFQEETRSKRRRWQHQEVKPEEKLFLIQSCCDDP